MGRPLLADGNPPFPPPPPQRAARPRCRPSPQPLRGRGLKTVFSINPTDGGLGTKGRGQLNVDRVMKGARAREMTGVLATRGGERRGRVREQKKGGARREFVS